MDIVTAGINSPFQGLEIKSLGGTKILIVEDAPESREFLVELISNAGAVVTAKPDGIEAVRALEQGSYDLILMDLQMPRMNGYEAAIIIRARGYKGPLLAITAQSNEEKATRWNEVGFTRIISKPITSQRLISYIVEHLGRDVGDSPPKKWSSPENALLDWECLMNISYRALLVVRKFSTSLEKQMDELQAISQKEDLTAALRFVHRIKGTSGNCSFLGLCNALAGFETSLRSEPSLQEKEQGMKRLRYVAEASTEECNHLFKTRAESCENAG